MTAISTAQRICLHSVSIGRLYVCGKGEETADVRQLAALELIRLEPLSPGETAIRMTDAGRAVLAEGYLAFAIRLSEEETLVWRIYDKNGWNTDNTSWGHGRLDQEIHDRTVAMLGDPPSEEQVDQMSAVEVRDLHLSWLLKASAATGIPLPRPRETTDPLRWKGLPD